MKRIEIRRFWQDGNQTLGNCTIYDENDLPLFSALSLERGWRNNLPNISCVPLGNYKCLLEWSPRFQKNLWELKDVPDRSECKFHSANHWHQLNGCIALGRTLTDLDGDGYRDITSSVSTMKAFHKALRHETEVWLHIKNDC